MSNYAATARSSELEDELRDAETKFTSEKLEIERKLRVAYDESRILREEVEDLRSEQSSAERHLRHDLDQLEAKHKALQLTVAAMQREDERKTGLLDTANQRLSQRETEAAVLENEILRLKGQAGNTDLLAVLQRELAEQVDHMKRVEADNLDQRIELKQLRKQQKAIEVVEEEKKLLESKLRQMSNLRKELGEAKLQWQILEDERKSWTSYLEVDCSLNDDGKIRSPEDLAKAYIGARMESASLVDKLGKVSPELIAKDDLIRSLGEEKTRLESALIKLQRTNGGTDQKSERRLDRQRALAVKEVEYLRGQLKTFDVEQNEFMPGKYDEQKSKRILELENLLDQHRKELTELHEDLKKHEILSARLETPAVGLKRAYEGEDEERFGQLSLRNRSLQQELANTTNASAVLEKELGALKSQLTALKASSRTRILEYRNNPTATIEATKASMLDVLRAENTALLARLESNVLSNDDGSSETKNLPRATLERLRLELAEKEAQIVSINKKTDRLKQVWGAKSREWRQTVASTLGWDFDFMPNGRVRVTSTFNPGISEEEGGEGQNSIIFDAEKGTMKCSGGPKSPFAAGIDEDIRFWVDDKKEVPCFLATLTLKFWDDTTKAQRVI